MLFAIRRARSEVVLPDLGSGASWSWRRVQSGATSEGTGLVNGTVSELTKIQPDQGDNAKYYEMDRPDHYRLPSIP